MTKMAAMPIYGKNIKKIFSRTRSPMILKLGMYHWGLKLYKVYINDDPGLTLTYFTTRSNWVIYTGKTVRPKKKIVVFQVPCQKKTGSVGRL